MATADSIAPEPLEANTSTSLAVWKTRGQAAQHALVELHEGGRAVVEHRLGHHLGDAGGSGVGPAVIRYCLMKGFGVMREVGAAG